MKIEDVNQQAAAAYVGAQRADNKQPETADAHSDGAAKQQVATDKVDLSSYMPVAGSRQRQDVRVQKIEDLKAQIGAGTYQVPGSAVAEKMLSKIVMPSSL
ncbi:flagellar biosynthesis anti-sigma factor FlgM [Geomonas sp. Red32]|uniref:flagellar biosynthesis anti-sigma factor FlgM n=1 Tax=Geomonas sp. Red32 TaxID=2912856 RepID=UPI00202CE695|nr:flagellar biosynthesis anti-sigma factor FlgM [Geomonas sp. Red32]MCM0082973.1 flagellar biosynthesis anti-sigma factor FlgM [Geomonas sp. Red32]